MHKCPTCGQELPPKLKVTGTVRQRMVDIIAKRPQGISSQDLIALVYAEDPDGGPESMSIISALVYLANVQLRKQGYRIVSTLGRGAKYSLVRTNGHTVRQRTGSIDARQMGRAQSAGSKELNRR
jgi:hypothetical protein